MRSYGGIASASTTASVYRTWTGSRDFGVVFPCLLLLFRHCAEDEQCALTEQDEILRGGPVPSQGLFERLFELVLFDLLDEGGAGYAENPGRPGPVSLLGGEGSRYVLALDLLEGLAGERGPGPPASFL